MNYIRKLLNLVTKEGKKTIAVKTVNNSLEKLKKRIPLKKLDLIFNRIVPAVKIYKKKVAGKVYQLPAVIKRERALFQTAKWILLAAEAENKGKKLSLRLVKVILDLRKKRGHVWKLKKQYAAVIKENRSYMRFIRKKRKKMKSWLFQQRFTRRILKKETKELLKERKKEKLALLGKKKWEKPKKFSIKNYEQDKKFSSKNSKPRGQVISRDNYSSKKIKLNKKVI